MDPRCSGPGSGADEALKPPGSRSWQSRDVGRMGEYESIKALTKAVPPASSSRIGARDTADRRQVFTSIVVCRGRRGGPRAGCETLEADQLESAHRRARREASQLDGRGRGGGEEQPAWRGRTPGRSLPTFRSHSGRGFRAGPRPTSAVQSGLARMSARRMRLA